MSELAAALAKIQANLPRIPKNSNAQYGKYADLADVNGILLPILAAEGLTWTCWPTMLDGQFVLRCILIHADSDDELSCFYPLPSSAPQTMGGAITYARRYALLAVTGVVADDDDDAQVAQEAHRAGKARAQDVDESLWTDQPAGTLPPLVKDELLPEQRPGSIDGKQQTRLQLMCVRDLGMADHDQMLAEWGKFLGRPLESRKDPSWVEAEALVKFYAPLAAEARKLAGKL